MVDRVLRHVENTLAAASFMVITAVALMNVISRYLLNASLAFTNEITVNLAVWMTMIGTAIAVRERAHLGFSLLHEKARGPARHLFTGLIALVVALFLAVVIIHGWDQTMSQRESGRTTPSIEIPQWWFSLALPLGAGLALLRTVQVAIGDFRGHPDTAHDSVGGPVA
jgi:C4-dicarboxylate transporter DctQ subunit